MTASALQRLITPTNLLCTWEAFWPHVSKQHSCGVDGVTPAKFHERATRHLAKLHDELRIGYRFSLLRAHPIPKKDGKTFRIICVPTVRDRIVQRLLAKYLTDVSDKLGIINKASFGFIRNSEGCRRGVVPARDYAIQLRNLHRWAYKSDISSFFDRIPRDELVGQTISALRTRSLKSLLAGAAGCEIDDNEPSIRRIAYENGIRKGLGIRQGMPLSPIFSNVILKSFDEAMIGRGYNLVRYADDFLVLADNEKQCLEIDDFARSTLRKLHFDLPPLGPEHSKTRIVEPASEIEFLGLALAPTRNGAYELLITSQQLQNIKQSVAALNDVEWLVRVGIDITTFGKLIDDKIGGYAAAYDVASNSAVLRSLLAKMRAEILGSIFRKAFGDDKVRALPSRYRKFFSLESSAELRRHG